MYLIVPKYRILLGVLLIVCQLHAQSNLKTKLLDPEVRHGVLENGMEYFIKKNPQPKKRASFYLVQKVGAILEEDHQNGLAHMLEHFSVQWFSKFSKQRNARFFRTSWS